MLIVLLSVFASLSTADICISGGTGGNGQIISGNFEATGSYYTRQICATETAYLQQINGDWLVSSAVGSNAAYFQCNDETSTPQACSLWKNNGVIDSSVKASTTACPPPDLPCSTLTISGAASYLNGDYVKQSTNLYAKGDYLFQYYNRGKYYVVSKTDDRNKCNGPTAYLRLRDLALNNIQSGGSMTLSLEAGGDSATFKCDVSAQSNPEPAPVPVPELPAGNLCVYSKLNEGQTATTGGVDVATLRGPYIKETGITRGGKVSYKRSGCGGADRYIMYNTRYKRYMLMTNPSNLDSYIIYCSEEGDDNPFTCSFTPNDYVDVSDSGSCGCEQNQAASFPIMDEPAVNTGFWSRFIALLQTEAMSVIFMVIFIMMCCWSILMCGYHCGYYKNNGSTYFAANKIIDDDEV